MARLTTADYELLLRAVEELASSEGLDDLRERAVATMPTLVRNDRTAWNELQLATASIVQLTEPPVTIPDAEAIFTEAASSHPVLQHSIRTGDGRPRAISDFLSVDEFHATPIYQRFYRLLDAEDQIAFRLPKADAHIAIALNRPQRGFSGRDREILNRMRPHLASAHRSVTVRDRLRRALTAVESTLERRSEGVVLLASDGSVEHISDVAADILHRAEPDEGARQSALRAAAGGTTLHELASLLGGHATVERCRHDAGGTALLLRTLTTNADVARDLQAFGLTPREAEVLSLAVTGQSNRSIAAVLYIGVRTVESHMRQALEKLGVANRVEAASLVHRLVAESSS